MKTLTLKSTACGLIDSFLWGMLWLIAVVWVWAILDRMQVEAYAAWGVGSFTEAMHKDGYSHDGYQSINIVFRFMLECADIIVGGLISFVYFLGFLYEPTRVTTIEFVERVGKSLSWTQVNFPNTYETKSLVFNRILSVENTQTVLQRLTGTETVVLVLLVMKGVTTEEVRVLIPGISRLSAEEVSVVLEYTGSSDIHKVSIV
jgi:hypothetical protein